MMHGSRTSSRGCRARPGATLIEVLAGLVVLGVLVTSVTLARARMARQWAEAERRLAAVVVRGVRGTWVTLGRARMGRRWGEAGWRLAGARALDAMVARWFDGPGEAIPVAGAGDLAGAAGCTWRTTLYGDPAARELG